MPPVGFNLFEKSFINPEVIAYGDSLKGKKEPLLKHAYEWYDRIGRLTEEQINARNSFKDVHRDWATGLKYVLGEWYCNCGQDPSDTSSIATMTGFSTQDCNIDGDHIASIVDYDNSSIEYLMIGVFGGLFRDGGTFEGLDVGAHRENHMVRHFIKQYVTLVDGSVLRCEGTDRNPKGNKWHVMEKRLKERAEKSGETGPRCMLLFRLLGAINLVLHVAHNYARTDGKEPLNLLLACIRNVEWLFDMPNCKPIGNEFIRLAPIPHPESCSLYLSNILVHTVEKLDRYARSAVFHFQGYLDDLFLPEVDGDGNVVKEDGVELKLPSLDEVEYFKYKANILGKSDAQIAAEREWLREKCRAAAAESDKLRKLAQAYFSEDGLPSGMEEEYQRWLDKYGDEEVLKEKMTNVLEAPAAGGAESARLLKLAQAYFSADGLPSEMEEEYQYWLGKYGGEEVLLQKMMNILEAPAEADRLRKLARAYFSEDGIPSEMEEEYQYWLGKYGDEEVLKQKMKAVLEAPAERARLLNLAQAYFAADGLPSEMEEEYQYWLGKYGDEEVLKKKMKAIFEASAVGGVEAARRATETNAILSKLVEENVNMTLEDVFEVVAEVEGSSGKFHVELDAFAKHFDIAVEELTKEGSPHVIEMEPGKVVVIFPGKHNATNNYFHSYCGKEYVDDWRRVLLLREGIDLSQWRNALEKKALNKAMEDQAAKDARAQEPEHTEDYKKKKERKAKKGNVGKLPSFIEK